MKFLFFSSITLLSFIYGLKASINHYPPYYLILDLYQKSNLYINSINIQEKFTKCSINLIDEIFNDSIVFIGHAYGSPFNQQSNDNFLSPKVVNFLSNYSFKISTLIFTGDIFFIPSIHKFQRLSDLTVHTKVFIAPGNHEISRPDSMDVFKLSFFGKQIYPIFYEHDDYLLIIEDSYSNQWSVSDQTINYLNNNDIAKKIIIARHNIPIKEFSYLANSNENKAIDLNNLQDLKNKIKKNYEIIWIIGDSGAHPNLPRFSCLRNDNNIFIINGLGDLDTDNIIILSNGIIYRYVLKN